MTVKWQFIYARKVSIAELREFTVTWVEGATRGRATEMRVLLRDYVELLILTGMRHGTEAMRIRWRHCDWYVDAEGQRYLRIWVSGKQGVHVDHHWRYGVRSQPVIGSASAREVAH